MVSVSRCWQRAPWVGHGEWQLVASWWSGAAARMQAKATGC